MIIVRYEVLFYDVARCLEEHQSSSLLREGTC
jgi:hypothetical protein